MAWLPLGSSAGCSSGGTGPPPGPMTTGPRTLTAIWAIASPPSVTNARKPTPSTTASARRVLDHIGVLLPGILGISAGSRPLGIVAQRAGDGQAQSHLTTTNDNRPPLAPARENRGE